MGGYVLELVLPAGFEPAISGLRARGPGPLDDDSANLAECFGFGSFSDKSILGSF
jgi:hypothetical protein